MEGAKSPLGSYELPTGVKVDEVGVIKNIIFREMTGIEEDVLASQKMLTATKLTQIIANCITKFGDIEDRAQINAFAKRLVVTDRWGCLLQLRSLSVGNIFTFVTTCPDSECAHKDKVDYDLAQIKIERPPNADELFREFELADGRKIRWKIADGAVEEKIEKIATDQNKATVGLYARVDSIDGKPAGIESIKILPMKERSRFRNAIEKEEGDFDDEYKATCPKCHNEYTSDMELSGSEFFFPSE